MDKGTDTHLFGSEKNGEFGIYTDRSNLPLTDCPSYLNVAIGAVCQKGSATVIVFNTKFRIVPGMVVTLLPWQLASVKNVSDDFRISFFMISQDMFTDTLSSLWRITPGFIFYMRKHIASEPDEGYIQRFLNFCDLLAFRAEHAPSDCRRESLMQFLRIYYWDVYTAYINDPEIKHITYTRKEEYAFRFLRMILEDHSPDKDVAYYSGKLGITPKYLTNLIRSISGHSARDWIVYHIILEIKALLRESSLDLKSIVAKMNFPDQSTMSRFFRHYTGMTPSQYRKMIHF